MCRLLNTYYAIGFNLFVTNVKCFCFLLISQALFCISAVSHLLYRKLWENYLFYVFVNLVKVLNMCVYRCACVCVCVCAPPFLTFAPGKFMCDCEQSSRDSWRPFREESAIFVLLSSTVFPFLWFCGSSSVCQHPAVFSPGLHLSLSSGFGLFLLPVLLV